MLRPSLWQFCWLLGFSLTAGCSQLNGANTAKDSEKEPTATDATAVLAKKDDGGIIFRARYYRTKGPCIRMGGSWAMPVVDGFEVVAVVKGKLRATNIEVRPLSGGGSAYPKELSEGKVYTLRLTPSAETNQQLGENEKEGASVVWVDGDEIEEQRVGK